MRGDARGALGVLSMIYNHSLRIPNTAFRARRIYSGKSSFPSLPALYLLFPAGDLRVQRIANVSIPNSVVHTVKFPTLCTAR